MGSSEQSKQFERLERHIKTSRSLAELAHWDGVRIRSAVSAKEDVALVAIVSVRIREILKETFGRKVT